MPAVTEPEKGGDWEQEAEKWKAKALDSEAKVKELSGADDDAKRLEAEVEETKAEAAASIEQVKAEAEAAAASVTEAATAEATDWEQEAEKWKAISRKWEDRAKTNRAALQRLEATEDKLASQGEEAEATAAELAEKAEEAAARADRMEVAQEMGVPPEMVQFLTGTTREEIVKQADNVLKLIESNPNNGDTEAEAQAEAEAEQQKEQDAITEAKARAEAAELRALRLEVAAAAGLPTEVASILSANTREDLEAQAEVLAAVTGKPETGTRGKLPGAGRRSGAAQEAPPDLDPDPGELAARLRRRY